MDVAPRLQSLFVASCVGASIFAVVVFLLLVVGRPEPQGFDVNQHRVVGGDASGRRDQ